MYISRAKVLMHEYNEFNAQDGGLLCTCVKKTDETSDFRTTN